MVLCVCPCECQPTSFTALCFLPCFQLFCGGSSCYPTEILSTQVMPILGCLFHFRHLPSSYSCQRYVATFLAQAFVSPSSKAPFQILSVMPSPSLDTPLVGSNVHLSSIHQMVQICSRGIEHLPPPLYLSIAPSAALYGSFRGSRLSSLTLDLMVFRVHCGGLGEPSSFFLLSSYHLISTNAIPVQDELLIETVAAGMGYSRDDSYFQRSCNLVKWSISWHHKH
ncbi:hypothetical protein L7F22_017829 [Adiantum nelumboides]|nr:hypothetical protein [Adiantum nelumboides]